MERQTNPSPSGQIHTNTLVQVRVYKCRSSQHHRFFTHLTWTDEEHDAASLEHGG